MELTKGETTLFEREADDYAALLAKVSTANTEHKTRGIELTSVGQWGGASSVVRGAPCGGFLLRIGNRTLILDPGENSVKFLVGQGFDPYEITDVLASHSHNDHVGELSLAVSAAINLGLSAECDGKIIVVPALADYTHASATRFGFTLPSYAWKADVVLLHWRGAAATLHDGSVVQSAPHTTIADTIRVKATEARHGNVMSTGFLIETPLGKIGYSGDTEYFPELAEWHQGADVLWLNMNTLAIDAQAMGETGNDCLHAPTHTHLGYVGACKLIEQVRPKTAIVTHFGAQLEHQHKAIETALQIRFAPQGITVACPRTGDSFVFEQSLADTPNREAFRP